MATVNICEGSDVLRRVVALILQGDNHRPAFGVGTAGDRPDVQVVGTNVGGWRTVVDEARGYDVPVVLLVDGGIPAADLPTEGITLVRRPFDVDDILGAVKMALAARR